MKYFRSAAPFLLPGAVLLLLVCLLKSCTSSFGYVEEEAYVSPQGTRTVMVKYDAMSRPDLFRPGLLWDEKLWDYPEQGFMETVHFGVEWLSEDQIRLTYDDVTSDEYDEAYLITLPD